LKNLLRFVKSGVVVILKSFNFSNEFKSFSRGTKHLYFGNTSSDSVLLLKSTSSVSSRILKFCYDLVNRFFVLTGGIKMSYLERLKHRFFGKWYGFEDYRDFLENREEKLSLVREVYNE